MLIAYSWAPILQWISILFLAIAGLKVGPAWLFIVLGYGLVALRQLQSRSFSVGLQRSINSLNAERLHQLSKKAKDIYWGKGGEFWHDMAEALALFIELKEEEANKLIDKWQAQVSTLPKEIIHLPGNYRLIGNALMRKWDRIVEVFELELAKEELVNNDQIKNAKDSKSKKKKAISPSILLPTARAYAELGDFEKAYQCIVKARLDETQYPLAYIGQSILPFFALIGARKQTEQLLEILDQNKNTFPESLISYWRGQSHLSVGNTETAIKFFEESKVQNPSKEFCLRVDRQIERARAKVGEIISFHPEKDKQVHDVWNIFERADFVLAVINPSSKSKAILALFSINTILYFITDAFRLPGFQQNFENAFTVMVDATNWILLNLALFPKEALAGQYYRFFTYSFLHSSFTHYFLNMIMLYWFGRLAQNIFGTTRFLAIYIVGGVLSGVAQAVIAPELVTVGASGSLMAAFGAVLAGIYRLKDRLPKQVWEYQMIVLLGLAFAQLALVDKILPYVAPLAFPNMMPHIAEYAHLGGFVAGVAFGLLVSPVPPKITDRFIDEEAVNMSESTLLTQADGFDERQENKSDN
jgi:membrane associated rhomboid family serine protease